MNTEALALLNAYKAKRYGGGPAAPVTSEALVCRFRRENPGPAAEIASDIRANVTAYCEETGLSADLLGRLANILAAT